jgi:hypothetical protein
MDDLFKADVDSFVEALKKQLKVDSDLPPDEGRMVFPDGRVIRIINIGTGEDDDQSD